MRPKFYEALRSISKSEFQYLSGKFRHKWGALLNNSSFVKIDTKNIEACQGSKGPVIVMRMYTSMAPSKGTPARFLWNAIRREAFDTSVLDLLMKPSTCSHLFIKTLASPRELAAIALKLFCAGFLILPRW